MKAYGDSSNLRRKFSLQFQACFLRLFLLWAIEFLNQMTLRSWHKCAPPHSRVKNSEEEMPGIFPLLEKSPLGLSLYERSHL